MKWLKSLLAFFRSLFRGGGTTPDEPDVPDTPYTGDDTQRASFLFHNAQTRAMNVLAESAADNWVEGVRQVQKANGDWTAWLFLSNQADGSPVPTTIYHDMVGGQINERRVQMMRRRIQDYRRAGFKVVGWCTADDSPAVSNASLSELKRLVRDQHEQLGDLIDEYCIGLEMNEDNRRRHAKELISYLKQVSGKRVGVHLTTGRWQEAVDWGADVLYYQAGFGNTAADVRAQVQRTIASLAGRCVFVLAEYHKSSDSAEAKDIGRVAMSVTGCQGTGNGR